jgi:hypothetical protein
MGGTTTSDSLTGTGVPYAGSALPIEYGNFANYITENKPETAVLRFGAADAIRLNDSATTLANIEEMVKVSNANGTKPILVGVTPFAKMGDFNAGNIDAGITDSMIASANAINKGIEDLATKYGVQFIDVRQVPVTQGALLDGVHPSGEYGAALNNYIANEIKDAGVFKQAAKAAEPTALSVAPQTLAPATTNEITSGLLSAVTQPEVDYFAQQFAPDVNSPVAVTPSAVSDTVTDYQGKTYDKATLLNLAKELAPSIDANRLKGGVYSTTGQSIGFNYDEATNALGYAPSAAEQVVLDMARHLMDEGVTSADQIEATDTNRRFGSTYSGEGGTVYEIKRDENGNLVTSTWGRTTSDKGNIIAAATIAAAFMGVPADIGTAVLGQGATSAAINTVGGAIFGGGTAALTGGDIVKGALLGGAGGALGDYLNTAAGAALGDASDIAMTMADAGSSLAEIETALTNSGFSPSVVADSLKDASNVLASTTSTVTTAPSSIPSLLDTVSVVAPSTAPALTNLLGAASVIPTTTPTQVIAPISTVNVEAAKTPQQVDQRVLDLVNSQIASNVTTPSNLANVQVTAPKTTTTQDVINTIAATIPITPITTTPVAEQTITSNKPATAQDIVTALTSTIPITNAQATYVAEQVISSNRPVTTQDVINAITTVIPAVTPTVTPTTTPTTTPTKIEEVKVTAPKTVTTQDIINAITTVVPTSVAPPVIPTQTIIAERPSTITDAVTAATIPLVQPTTPLTPTEVKAQTELTNTEKIRLAQLGLTTAGLLGAGAAVSGGPTQYDIVPVPTDWTSPQTIAATYNYPRPIDFGNRNLLMGTQWEKFLDPNYGRVPEPTIYSQPSNLSYSDLMGILGNKQGMPFSSNLSINDIISGIQNQYGQVPSRTMG